jgi:hypothetical protein
MLTRATKSKSLQKLRKIWKQRWLKRDLRKKNLMEIRLKRLYLIGYTSRNDMM